MSEPKNGGPNPSRRTFIKGVGGAMSVAWISELPSFVLAGNERIGPLVIDVKTGRFIGIWNSLNQVEYGLENWLFEVQLEGATLRSDQAQKVTAEAGPGLIRLKHDYAG